ncbi:MAG: PAS domain-containing protein [Pseudomonadota bacterium]
MSTCVAPGVARIVNKCALGAARKRRPSGNVQHMKVTAATLDDDGRILDALGVALLAVDREGRIQRFNPQAEALLGLPAAQVLGRVCHQVMDTSLCGEGCPLRAAMATRTTARQGTAVVRVAEQTTALVELTASVLLDAAGEACGAVALLRDARADTGELRCYGRRLFVSRTPAMRRLFDELPRLAASPAPLLVEGERGSGRAALVEIVHGLDPERAGAPLRRVLCSGARALAQLQQVSTAIASEGNVLGSVLLEDLGAASLETQQRLLGWLEERSDRDTPRLLSTATGLLRERLQRGEFRRDLYHRLAVLQVRLPSLAQRRDDLPLLVQEFIEDLQQRHGGPVRGISPAAMQRLGAEALVGNVRQLRQILEAAHTRSPGPLIAVEDLHLPSQQPPRSGVLDAGEVQRVLAEAGGNVRRAAQQLGVHRSTLWRAMRRLGIES